MNDLIWQLFGAALLLGGVGWGYWRWVRPHTHLSLAGRGLLLLVILTGMGGLIGSPIWWLDVAGSFSWDLPPLAGRMLASAGWAFVAASWLTLHWPTNGRVRLLLILLAVYLVPLVGAIFIFHLSRFDFSALVTYGFFAIAGGMSIATLSYLRGQPPILLNEPSPQPAPQVVQYWLVAVAVVTSLWGLALFATDAGPLAWVWVWPGDWLTSQLIGVMLLAIGAGSWWGRKQKDTAVVMLVVIFIYGLGLSVAALWNSLAGKPIPLSYLVVFTFIAFGTAVVYKLGTVAPEARH